MRTLIDANVVLRYRLHDDETKFPVAEKTIREGAYLLPEVLAEVVYVLLGVYSVPREEIASRLQILVKEVQTEHTEVLERLFPVIREKKRLKPQPRIAQALDFRR